MCQAVGGDGVTSLIHTCIVRQAAGWAVFGVDIKMAIAANPASGEALSVLTAGSEAPRGLLARSDGSPRPHIEDEMIVDTEDTILKM